MNSCCQQVGLIGDPHEVERHRVWHLSGGTEALEKAARDIAAARREGVIEGLERAAEIATDLVAVWTGKEQVVARQAGMTIYHHIEAKAEHLRRGE